MNTPFDYQELIDELKEEIGFGIISNTTTIQILRSEEAETDGYYQILDWYYNKETMAIELEADVADSEDDAKEKEMIREQYQQDLGQLEDITVESCLTEMFDKTPAKPKKSRGNKKSNPFF